jgi:hypothetical protein
MRSVYLLMAMIAALAVPAGAAMAAPKTPAPKAAAPKVPPTPPQLIARLDGLIATVDKGNVLIQARGAVNSGGWRQGKLRPLKGDAHTIVVEFVAVPPAPTQAVIEGLLPIHAATTVRLRKGVVAVRVMSGSNEITTEILK